MPYKDKEKAKANQKLWRWLNAKELKKRKRLYALSEKGKEVSKRSSKKHRDKNKDLLNANAKKYYYNNLEKVLETKRKCRQKRKAQDLAYCRLRQANKINATPKWANLEKIKEIYLNRPEGYHVDHIVPLVNKNVCGLHVENNLQYLTAKENIKKGNKFKV